VENSSASKPRPTLPRLQHSQEEQETSTSDAESEPQPQRRGRHKRAPGAPANGGDESEDDSQSGGSGPEGDSESENGSDENAAPSHVQRKPTKPTMKPVRVAASSGGVNSVRQRAVAGAQPLPASSFLSIVHACPNLMGECCCCRRMTWPAHGLVLFEVGRSTVQAALAFDEST
jgi:hypothetical protein